MTAGARLELGVALGAFVVFAIGAAGGATWMDSGELAVTGYQLGGPHPPGHPLFALLAKLASLVPLGEIGFRIALLSSASAAAALAGVIRLARVVVPEQHVAATGAAVLLSLSPALYYNAVRVEVYAPTLALLVWGSVAVLRALRAPDQRRQLVIGAFALAMAAAIHPVLAATAGLPLLFGAAVVLRKRPRLIAAAIAVGCLALCTYAYLPLRATALSEPFLMWGDPSSLGGFVDVVTGSAYQGNFTAAAWLERVGESIGLLSEGAAVALLIGGLLGLGLSSITRLRGAPWLLLILATTVFGAALQSALNPDLRAYLLPVLAMLAVGLAIASEALYRMVFTGEDAPEHGRAITAVVVVGGFALFALVGPTSAGTPTLGDSDDLLSLHDATLDRMDAGPGVFFANSDHSLFAAQYERWIAGARPDIAVANASLCRDIWFLRHLDRALPPLFVPFIDDDLPISPAERLAVVNVEAGRPVGMDVPGFGALRRDLLRPRGWGYQLVRQNAPPAQAEPVPAPLVFSGYVGTRVAGATHMARAVFEAKRGELSAAARAARLPADDTAAIEAAVAADIPAQRRPSLLSFIPKVSREFIFEPWRAGLVHDDLRWQAGIAPAEAVGPTERLVHRAWRELLEGNAKAATDYLTSAGRHVVGATARMLLSLSLDRAEPFLRAAIARDPGDADSLAVLGSQLANRSPNTDGGAANTTLSEAAELLARAAALAPSAETYARLGVVRARQGDFAAAKRAWTAALELDPSRDNVRRWLADLDNP